MKTINDVKLVWQNKKKKISNNFSSMKKGPVSLTKETENGFHYAMTHRARIPIISRGKQYLDS